jgi:hypothetical protein
LIPRPRIQVSDGTKKRRAKSQNLSTTSDDTVDLSHRAYTNLTNDRPISRAGFPSGVQLLAYYFCGVRTISLATNRRAHIRKANVVHSLQCPEHEQNNFLKDWERAMNSTVAANGATAIPATRSRSPLQEWTNHRDHFRLRKKKF